MTSIARTTRVARLALADVALVVAACLIPALSHVVGWPLYKLNPMLALLLAGVAVGRDWRNGLLLALLMPLVSGLLVGMPTASKMVCMMVELGVVAAVFGGLQRRWAVLPSVLVAAVVGKVVYYAMKALLLPGVALVGTEWWMQVGAVLLWGGLFALIYKRK